MSSPIFAPFIAEAWVSPMVHEVIFRPAAQQDLVDLYHYIADHAGFTTAMTYIERIEAACLSLNRFPRRIRARDDVFPGLRVMVFEGRSLICFIESGQKVRVLRVLHGGRDFPDGWDLGPDWDDDGTS